MNRRAYSISLATTLSLLALTGAGCQEGVSYPQFGGEYELVPGSVTYSTDDFEGDFKPSEKLTVTHFMRHINNELFGHELSLDFEPQAEYEAEGRINLNLDIATTWVHAKQPTKPGSPRGWTFYTEKEIRYGGIACYLKFRYSLYLETTPSYADLIKDLYVLKKQERLGTDGMGQPIYTSYDKNLSFESQFMPDERKVDAWNDQLAQAGDHLELKFVITRDIESVPDGTGTVDGICALPQDPQNRGYAQMTMTYRSVEGGLVDEDLITTLGQEAPDPTFTLSGKFFSQLIKWMKI